MDRISLDLEQKKGNLSFYLLPGISIFSRIVVFIALTVGGASIMFRFNEYIGGAVFVAGLGMIVGKGISNTRKSEDTVSDRWVVGSAKDMRKIERKIEQMEKIPSSAMNAFTCMGCMSLIAFAAIFAVADVYIIPFHVMDRHIGSILFIQASILIAAFFTTQASKWTPDMIKAKKDLFFRERDHIMNNWKKLNPMVRPMLLLDEGSSDDVTPEDIKLFITFDKAPEDFLGVQAQITFNMNQPYLYCVVLAKDTFSLLKNYKPTPASNITFEKGLDNDVRFLVVRQYTTRDSGYSTTSKQADHVVDTAMKVCVDLLMG